MSDYYSLLQIHRNSSSEDIKKSFRKLSLKYHPDLNDSQNAHEQFIKLNEAYQILSDPQKRARYNFLYDYQLTSWNNQHYYKKTSAPKTYYRPEPFVHTPTTPEFEPLPIRVLIVAATCVLTLPSIFLLILIAIFGTDNPEIRSIIPWY